jgi:amino acid transporter
MSTQGSVETGVVGVSREELKPALRPLHVAALALGCIIGFGAFVLPGDFLRMAGPVGAAVGVALGSVTMVVIALSYGILVRTFPVAGGEFAYAYHAAGRYHAYICGWLLALGYLCIVPLNATALAVLGKFLAPQVFARGYLYSVAGFDVYAGEVLLASAAIILIGYFQQRGVKEVGMLQFALTGTMVMAVILIALGTMISDEAALANFEPGVPPERTPLSAVLSIFAISAWLYVGFDTLPQSAEEFDFSPREGQRLMIWAILAGAVMYITVILSTAAVLPWRGLIESGTVWATGTTARTSLGTLGVAFLAVAVCMAVLTGINGFFIASSRLMFGMGRAQVLPSWFARIHPTRHTPHNAILFTGLLSLLAPWFGREVILWIVDMAAVGTSVAFLYTCYAAFVVARRLGERSSLRQQVAAGLGMVFSAGFLVLLMVPGMPGFMARPSWIALSAWLLLGAVFFAARSSHYRKIPERELDFLVLGQHGVHKDPAKRAEPAHLPT